MFKNILNRNVSLVIICCLSLISCERNITEPCFCETIPEYPSALIGYDYAYEVGRVLKTQFNPNNDNEFVYYKTNTIEEGVYVYNMETEESTLVYSGYVKYGPEWGANDWILLNLGDSEIYKIRSNGSNLTQLTFDGGNYYPHWNLTADSILYSKNTDTITLLMNDNGIILDTLNDFFNSSLTVWNHEKYILSRPYGVFNLINTFDFTYDAIYNTNIDYLNYDGCEDEELLLYGNVWVGDDIYYSHDLGIYKININGTGSSLIKESCRLIKYRRPSVNMSQNRLLWVKQTWELAGINLLKETNEVVVMDLDGQNETVIEIN